MAIRSTDKDHHVVQVQRGPLRRTKRVTGTLAEARKVEESLIAELVRELELDVAAARLGVDRASPAGRPIPLLRDFYSERWVSHAKVVQNKTTQRARQSSWRYLLYYCGDKRLDELCRPAEVNALVEALKLKGPIVFTKRRNGEPYAPRSKALTNATINGVLSALRSLLNLAHTEGVIPMAPKVDSLPMDDSTPVVPPSEEQFKRLVRAAEDFREVAPLLPEVIEFAAETGLRRSELFHLTWGSVELERDAIRIEAQGKARVVNGAVWRPKCNKWREVPLSKKAKQILLARLADGPRPADEEVFPSRYGAPYVRLDTAGEDSGKGYFNDAVQAARLKGKVTFHSLRHLWAVRLLTRGVPITIVSELLGHSHIQITVKRYGRFASDARVRWDAIRVLDQPEAETPPPPVQQPAAPRLVALEGGRRGKWVAE